MKRLYKYLDKSIHNIVEQIEPFTFYFMVTIVWACIVYRWWRHEWWPWSVLGIFIILCNGWLAVYHYRKKVRWYAQEN